MAPNTRVIPARAREQKELADREVDLTTQHQPMRKINPGLLTRLGPVEVKIFVANTSAETLKRLKELGLEGLTVVQPDRIVTGKIAAGKLAAVARLEPVRYIAPLRSATKPGY